MFADRIFGRIDLLVEASQFVNSLSAKQGALALIIMSYKQTVELHDADSPNTGYMMYHWRMHLGNLRLFR